LKHIDHEGQARRPELARLPQPVNRRRERTRFAAVLEDAAELLERRGELPTPSAGCARKHAPGDSDEAATPATAGAAADWRR